MGTYWIGSFIRRGNALSPLAHAHWGETMWRYSKRADRRRVLTRNWICCHLPNLQNYEKCVYVVYATQTVTFCSGSLSRLVHFFIEYFFCNIIINFINLIFLIESEMHITSKYFVLPENYSTLSILRAYACAFPLYPQNVMYYFLCSINGIVLITKAMSQDTHFDIQHKHFLIYSL